MRGRLVAPLGRLKEAADEFSYVFARILALHLLDESEELLPAGEAETFTDYIGDKSFFKPEEKLVINKLDAFIAISTPPEISPENLPRPASWRRLPSASMPLQHTPVPQL